MKVPRSRSTAPVAALAIAAMSAAPAVATTAATSATSVASVSTVTAKPWMNTALTPAKRAALLVAQMTLDEKIAEVHGAGYPLFADPTAGHAGVVPGNARLGIPPLYLADSPLGVGSNNTGVTQWADTAALASTWDVSLAHQYGVAYGAEQAGKGNNIALMPTVNILRTPLWGRAPETYSEDPYLTARQSTAVITGVQSQHVIATIKHFVANNQEILRSHINVVASGKAKNEIYYPAFKSAVNAGVGAVMCSYNRVGGTYACENAEELTGTLRDAWKFDGLVMSDWGALHSTVKAAKAGLDLEMPGAADDNNLTPIDRLFGGSHFNSKLKAAVQSGSVSMAELNRMVTSIFTAMFRIGLFDHPLPNPATLKNAVVSTSAHVALTSRIAEQGTVLLKNAGGALPLKASSVGSVAVIGDAAKNPITTGGGSAVVKPSAPVVTPLAGITARAGSSATVTYAQGTLGLNALPAVPASAFGSGLTATYYSTANLTGTPIATQTVPDLNITGKPSAVGSATTWSARYTGTLTAPATGTYRFSLQAGAYVTVWIDGKQAVSFKPWREPTQDGLLALTAGAHAIRVDVTPLVANIVTVDAFAVTPGLHLGWQPQENLLVAQAAAAAKAAKVAVVVVSANASEGWDRRDLELPADQNSLIEAVAAANPHTIVVLNTSSAVTMPWLGKVAGVVETWFGGQTAGTALARVLFGDVNPSGKLPVTFPATDQQGPLRKAVEYPGDGNDVYYDEGVLVGYRWYDTKGQRPLFPFGYGLSYTSFRFSGMRVLRSGTGYVVTARVTNTGSRTGSDVVQLYVGSPARAHEPVRQLKAYAKVALRAGQTKVVRLRLDRSALAAWNNADAGWQVYRGTYRFYVGDSSRHLPFSAKIRL